MSNSCDVCLYGAEDIENDFSHEETRRARKIHTCAECQQLIQPGYHYLVETVKSRGRIASQKICLSCNEVREVFYCHGNGWYWGQLWEDMREQAFPHLTTASPCFTELSLPARQHVLDRWRAWKGLNE